jgi:hypothetical protein
MYLSIPVVWVSMPMRQRSWSGYTGKFDPVSVRQIVHIRTDVERMLIMSAYETL